MNAGLKDLPPEYLAVVHMAPPSVSVIRSTSGNYIIQHSGPDVRGGYVTSSRYVSVREHPPEEWLRAMADVVTE